MKTEHALIERYLDMLVHLRKLSSHTLSTYRRDLQLLQGFAEKIAVEKLNQTQLRSFVANLNRTGYAPASIARILSAWRGFFQWLVEDCHLPINPIIGLKAPRQAKRLPKALSVEHAVSLSEYVDSTPAIIRDHAMCELLYSSGLRLSELVQLDWRYFSEQNYQSIGWLDLEASQVVILGKGSKRRSLPVGQHACTALRNWLAIRATFTRYPIDPHALFIAPRGKRINHRLVHTRIQKLAQIAGLPTHVHPHMLRHSCASHLLQSSGNLRAVQQMLGHSRISSTQIYTSLDFQHLAKVYDNTHPRAKRAEDKTSEKSTKNEKNIIK